jgi:hypothetical protein
LPDPMSAGRVRPGHLLPAAKGQAGRCGRDGRACWAFALAAATQINSPKHTRVLNDGRPALGSETVKEAKRHGRLSRWQGDIYD